MWLSLLASCAFLCAPPAFAQPASHDPPLDEITVSGEFPGSETTVLRVEKLSDRDSQIARARAWATGDIEALTHMPELPDPSVACETAVLNALVASQVIPADIREQAMALWLDAAGTSMAANQITFALVPFENLTRAGGYLARLREKGYLIEEPT